MRRKGFAFAVGWGTIVKFDRGESHLRSQPRVNLVIHLNFLAIES